MIQLVEVLKTYLENNMIDLTTVELRNIEVFKEKLVRRSFWMCVCVKELNKG